MTLDTIERVKYFGLRSVSYCGICRNRCGRSCTRLATCHNPKEIEENYELAHMSSRMGGRRKRARDQLHRHGLDWTKRCRLHESAKHCLVHVDKWGPRLFAGLVRYERMHVYFINYCTYTMELLIKSVSSIHYPFIQRQIKACQQFRDPVTGTTHPRLPYLLKMTHLTAERRVRAIFYWAHVLGLKAEVIYQPIRRNVQCAVAYLQLLLIATRGHRPYTSQELMVIFEDVGRQLFIHLEVIAQFHDAKRLTRQQDDYNRDPVKNKAPVPFTAPKR